jgi:hypothetical protein
MCKTVVRYANYLKAVFCNAIHEVGALNDKGLDSLHQ